MDRGDDRRVDEPAVGQRQEVEAVVDHVELGRALEGVRDVEAFDDLRVDGRVLRVARDRRRTRAEPAVTESPLANSVTSTPFATSPSLRSDANCSHGP